MKSASTVRADCLSHLQVSAVRGVHCLFKPSHRLTLATFLLLLADVETPLDRLQVIQVTCVQVVQRLTPDGGVEAD